MNRGRGPKQKIRDADRRAQALLLRRAGKSYDEIAAALGLADKSSACKLVKYALEQLWVEPAEDVRKIEIERLELAVARAEESVARLDRVVAHYLPRAEAGDLDAADMVVKTEAARAKVEANRVRVGESLRKLLGLDSPEVRDVRLSTAATPAEARRVMQEIFGGNVGPDPVDGGEGDPDRSGEAGPPPSTTTH